MSRVDALEERLKKQERQVKTLSTQIEVLMQGMNELSLRQHSIKDTIQALPLTPAASSLDTTPRIPATFEPHYAERQLLERVAALEAKVGGLSEVNGHHRERFSPLATHCDDKGAILSEPAPSAEDCCSHSQCAAIKVGDGRLGEEGKRDALIPLGVLTAHRLDVGDMYEVNESVWDGCLFLGIAPLGSLVSTVMVAMYVLNFFVQLAFVMIAWSFMVEPQVTTDTLDGLLRFRVGVAHSVEYSDTVLQRSMAAQVCSDADSFKLHMAGAQRTLYFDSMAFSVGGPLLSLLAQLCWLGSMIKEVNAAYSFARSVMQIPRSDRTEVITADSTSDGLDAIDSLYKAPSRAARLGLPTGSLVALTVVTRLTAVSRGRLAWAVFGIAVPRVLLAMSVGFVGTLFLATSSAMSDLVLNAIALAFIIELDEMLYAVFAPRRLHTLMNNIEPLPMPPLHRCVPGLNCFLKMLFVAASVLLVKLLLLDPVFWRLTQAQNILCSGELDFVYSANAASGMVHVTKTAGPQEWSLTEKTILQAARPILERKHGWEIDQELLDLATSDFSMSVVTQTGMNPATGGVTLAESEHEPPYFNILSFMGKWDVSQAAPFMPCSDKEAGNSYAQVDWFLEQVTGIPGFTCSSISAGYSDDWRVQYFAGAEACSASWLVSVRALCPQACGCHLGKDGMTGLFGSMDFGCPIACTEWEAISDQWQFHHWKYADYVAYYYVYYSDGDAENSSNKSRGSQKGVCADALDVEMLGDPEQSLACLTDFSQCLELTGRFAQWYAIYVRGILPYMYSVWGVATRLETMATQMYDNGLLQVDSVPAYLGRFWGGGVSESLLDGRWTLTDAQAPHPRNLTGCRFLASYELQALLGFDLCNPSTLTSIRRMCPVSCGCIAGMDGCPAACTDIRFDDDGMRGKRDRNTTSP